MLLFLKKMCNCVLTTV